MNFKTIVSAYICMLGSILVGCASQPRTLASYDGHWTAQIPVQGRCPAAVWQLDVKGHDINGSARNPSGSYLLTGTIDSAGRGTIKINRMGGTIRFTASTFESDYFNNCGARHASGTRG